MNHLISAANDFFKVELRELEECLKSLLHSDIAVIDEMGAYLLGSGGKRFRPTLAILFYHLAGSQGPQSSAVELGAVVEMIHLATLAHDDVIDEAAERRSKPALWKASNNRMAVLQGDFIFSRAFSLLNKYTFEIRKYIITAVEEVLEGEILQNSLRNQVPSYEEYERVNIGKTAALMSAACAVGALVGNSELDDESLNSIYRAGTLMGESFQLVDDLLDVFGDERLGKARWTDQKGGWLNWPFIRLLEITKDNALRIELLEAEISSDRRMELLDLFDKHRIREELTNLAESKMSEMKALLDWMPESELKSLLFESSDFVIQRTS
jgi:octaprenyl-diphosphate synthase